MSAARDRLNKAVETLEPRAWMRVGAVVGVIVIIWFGFKVFAGDGEHAAPSEESQVTGTYAKLACERFVKDRLKAPATADFTGATATQIPDTKAFRVLGAVDSENGFGAKIRTGYTCQTYYSNNDDLWHLTDLAFDRH